MNEPTVNQAPAILRKLVAVVLVGTGLAIAMVFARADDRAVDKTPRQKPTAMPETAGHESPPAPPPRRQYSCLGCGMG
jgi:hypothetical protein